MSKSRSKPEDAPWWTGDRKKLLDHLNDWIGMSVDDLNDVMQILRRKGHYTESDRIRVIAGRLARLQRPNLGPEEEVRDLIREIARGW